MKKILLSFICFMALAAVSFGQLKYPVAGHYRGQFAEGMAIWGDNAYLMSTTGLCRVYNLQHEQVTAEFRLGSSGLNNHANSATFGREIPEGGVIPALYVTEWTPPGRCFVENIFPDRSELVQTIQVVEHGENVRIFTWTVDPENECMYGITRKKTSTGEAGPVTVTIRKFRLPRLDEGEKVTLTEADLMDMFSVSFINMVQGAKVRGRYLYILSGFSEFDRHRAESHRAVQVIDLKKKVLKKSIDLSHVMTCEPEDFDFYKNKPLVYGGQSGGLYRIKLK